MNFHIRSPLVETTQLYRYMTFNQFVSLVEQRKFYLTRIQNWEDTWELPSFSIPTKIETGEITYDSKMGEKYLYGSCWTRLGESDAMWRIYAPQRDGIMIKTTVKKFETLEQLSNGYISTVYYYNDLLDGLGKTLSDRDFRRPYSLGLIKREAFSHENEVRFLYYDNPIAKLAEKLENDPTLDLSQPDEYPDYVYSSFNPIDFIEGITIDPRAEEWLVNTIMMYSKRAGFKINPQKSKLYSKDVYGETGYHFVRRTL